MYRGIQKGWDFQLASNMEKAGKFDDLVFKYSDKTKTERSLFLQAKHSLKKSEKIVEEDLLDEGNEGYSLVKYFFSYRSDILSNPSFGTIEKMIICTNIDFDNKVKGYVNSILIDSNDILSFKTKTKADGTSPMHYQFKKDKSFIENLKRKLEHTKPAELAEKLIDHILKGKHLRVQEI